MRTSERAPQAAGLFYLGYDAGLLRDVTKMSGKTIPDSEKLNAIGVVVPHAGFEYSGSVAGTVYGHVKIPRRVIIMGPNHTGFGLDMALDDNRWWRTPLGKAEVDLDMVERLSGGSANIQVSRDAHRLEHSIEVQLPFLQYVRGDDLLFTPIAMKGNIDPGDYRSAGEEIAAVINNLGEEVLLIASSDFTHYEPLEYAKKMDSMAIDAIVALDPDRLLGTVYENDISMCGYGPVATMLYAAKEHGAVNAKLIKYGTSADFSMDESSVVGYGGLAVW